MTIPTHNPRNSSHLEHPREPRETAKAGQRRKCHIIDLFECSRAGKAGQRRKCHIIDLSECGIVIRLVFPPTRPGEPGRPPSQWGR